MTKLSDEVLIEMARAYTDATGQNIIPAAMQAAWDASPAGELETALRETWRVLRSAGLLNLSNGVQLGQTSWYVRICDAEAMSEAALSNLGAPHV